MSWRALLGAILTVAVSATLAGAADPEGGPPSSLQHPGLHPPLPEDESVARPHRKGELDCRGCHLSKHQGIVQMYLGIGGRGAPTIPSHMFQVRVECIACHIQPKLEPGEASVIGQTFRPSEQACLTCHGEKYRGLLGRWTSTLARMGETLAPKLRAAQAALATADRRNPKTTRATMLVRDAEFNVRYVALAKGVHNVFYAADLLKLANSWLDEATGLLGMSPVKVDDQLVRGKYCAILCHEAAGVRQPETVRFEKLRVPHVRHVTEFGATCTSCHSAESHKGVTATAATCAACHHGPQNERCEGCHRPQAAFYRGETKRALVEIEPNLMAAAVSCTGCHDFGHKHSRAAVAKKCLECHEASYAPLMREWTTGFDADLKTTAGALGRAESGLARARRAGRTTPEVEALVREAREALALVRRARPVHNPLAAGALLEAARARAEEALARTAAPRR